MGKASRKKKEAKAAKAMEKATPEVQSAAQEAAQAATGAVAMGGGLTTQEGKIADQLQGYSLEIKATLTEMQQTLETLAQPPQPAEAVIERKPLLSQIGETSEAVGKAGFDVFKFALLIPLLLSSEVRNKLMAVWEGLLQGLGISKEKIEKLKTVAKVVAGLLVAYWGYKTIKSVYDAFNSVYKLAQLMTVAALMTDSKDLELEKERDAAKKGKKEIRRQKAKIRLEKRKAGNLKGFARLKRLILRLGPMIGKKVLSAIPFVGTVASVAFLVADLGEEAFAAMDEAEEEAITKLVPLTVEEKSLLKDEGYTDEQIKAMEEEIALNRANHEKELRFLKAQRDSYEERLREGLVSPDEMMGGSNWAVEIETKEERMRKANERAGVDRQEAEPVKIERKSNNAPAPASPPPAVTPKVNAEDVKNKSERSNANRKDSAKGDTNVINVINNNDTWVMEPPTYAFGS